MKKIIFILISIICFSSTVYAFEETNKITDNNIHTQLTKRFKGYEEDDYCFYEAKTITQNILSMQKEHISDYFNTDFSTYYINPKNKSMGVSIMAIADFEKPNRKFSYSAAPDDETDMIFEIFREGKILEGKSIKEAYPLCVLDKNEKFSHSCIWVKYDDGNEEIFTDFTKKDEKTEYTVYTDEEYMKSFIIPDSENFEAQPPEYFPDCNDSAANTLLRLGFICGFEDGTFRPQNLLTRAEGTKLAVSFATTKDYISKLLENEYYVPIFSDVPKTHWSSSYVTLAAKGLNIIHGFGDETFRPEETLTKMQFAKMLVCALGFESEAIAEGGYPEGYKKTAEKLRIASDIEEAALSRAEAAQMIYNALFATVNIVEGYEMVGDSIAQISSKEVMMNYIHDIRTVEGELKITDINIVTVGDESFLMGYNDASKFEGENMIHFVQKNENGYEVWLCAN